MIRIRWYSAILMALFLQIEAVIPEKVILCTVCRDVSKHVPAMISDLEKIGSLFQDYRIVVYENNSEDDTPSQLYRWKRANPKVSLTVEFLSDAEFAKTIVNQTNGKFSRLEQRAQARNKALRMALSLFDEEFSYILCIDPTVKLSGLEEIKAIFQRPDNWDAVFAYRTDREGNFTDWGAFRDPFSLFGPEFMGDEWYREEKHFSLQKHEPWYPVYSAFGGFAIYKRKAIENCKYGAIANLDLELATRKWFFEALLRGSPSIDHYFQSLKSITNIVYIEPPRPNLPTLPDLNCGIYIVKEPFLLVWKMHGSFYQYPAVCEHVSLHASMYCLGFQRLFINPRLVSVERDSHYEFRPNQGESESYNW